MQHDPNRPEDVLKVDADEQGVGGDDAEADGGVRNFASVQGGQNSLWFWLAGMPVLGMNDYKGLLAGDIMRIRSLHSMQLLPVIFLVVWTVTPRLAGQTSVGLDIQTYAGLTITGAAGSVYSIQYVSDLAQTNNPSAWRCLEYLQLPASPFLWADKSAPATGKRFYRAVAFSAPTNMVFIPPGTFRMGDPTNAVEATLFVPQTAVTISRGFWMGKTEVTQGEYQAVMGNNPSFFNTNNGYGEDLSRPVERVSWYDATNYCAALTQRDRVEGRIATNSHYRLPTEAEWEYACRGWTSTRFSYGDDPGLTNLHNYGFFGGGGTRTVGLRLPNPWGLYDMHGNVWEWCQDWFGNYRGGIAVDPQGPATGSYPVVRGGAWDVAADGCRSAFRSFFFGPGNRNNVIGFRIVLAPGQP